MSEPLSSHEIEDVLSSIRRLVSDDLRPGGKIAAATAEQDGEAAGEAPGKLVLTPALRVVADEGGSAPAPSGPTASAGSRSPAQESEARALFGAAAPLGVSATSWSAPSAADPAGEEPLRLQTAAPATQVPDAAPVKAEAEEEDHSPIAVFTAARRPAPLLLTPETEMTRSDEAVPFIRRPRSGPATGESVVIDEMALRALLRQIVREELAAMQLTGGAAPDMRRMVRLELQRAISSES